MSITRHGHLRDYEFVTPTDWAEMSQAFVTTSNDATWTRLVNNNRPWTRLLTWISY